MQSSRQMKAGCLKQGHGNLVAWHSNTQPKERCRPSEGQTHIVEVLAQDCNQAQGAPCGVHHLNEHTVRRITRSAKRGTSGL